MDPDRREAKSAREDLPGLLGHAAAVHPTQPGRKSTGGNASPGYPNCLSTNDGAQSVSSDYPLHARCLTIRNAAGFAMALLA